MKAAVIQSNYLPWKGYFDMIHDVDVFCFYDEVKYTKNDWRNRNKLCNKNGVFWLTVPIAKDAVKQKISEVFLPDSKWKNEHYAIMFETYKKARHFDQLMQFLEDFYAGYDWKFLSSFNQYSIKKISEAIGINTKFVNSADFDLEEGRIDRLVNLLEKLGVSEYISGPAARDYIIGNEKEFQLKNIRITYKDYFGYPEYPQFSNSFQQYVSIIDMIAHVHIEDIPHFIWGWRDIKNQG